MQCPTHYCRSIRTDAVYWSADLLTNIFFLNPSHLDLFFLYRRHLKSPNLMYIKKGGTRISGDWIEFTCFKTRYVVYAVYTVSPIIMRNY